MWSFVRTACIESCGTSNWTALVVLSKDGSEESRLLDFGKSEPSAERVAEEAQRLCDAMNVVTE